MVHVWDSETLLKLQEIGLGAFERGVGALAFSVAVSWPWRLEAPIFPVREPPPCILHQEASEVLAFLSPTQPVLLRDSVAPSALSACRGTPGLIWTMNPETSRP